MKRTLVALGLIATMVGCANTTDPSTYSVGSVGQVNRSVSGVVISARYVNINTNTGVGAGVGGVAGAVAGSSIGGGARANALGAIGGAAAGSVTPMAAQRALWSSGRYLRGGLLDPAIPQNVLRPIVTGGLLPVFSE